VSSPLRSKRSKEPERKTERKRHVATLPLKAQRALLEHITAKAGLGSDVHRLAYEMGKGAAEHYRKALARDQERPRNLQAETILQALYEGMENGELDLRTANRIVNCLKQKMQNDIDSLRSEIGGGRLNPHSKSR